LRGKNDKHQTLTMINVLLKTYSVVGILS